MELLETWLVPYVALGLLAFSVAVTLLANWLAAQLRRSHVAPTHSVRTLAADAVWILLVFLAGLLAARYIERTPCAPIGFAVFGVAMFCLTFARAVLYRRATEALDSYEPGSSASLASELVQTIKYPLVATDLYLFLHLLLRRPADPVLLVPLCVGALLPDLDSQETLVGSALRPISRRLEGRFGSRKGWHTLAACLAIGLAAAPLIPIIGLQAWYLIPAGFLAHLVVDLFTPRGVMLLWPITYKRYTIATGWARANGDRSERALMGVLVIAAVVLLVAVETGSSHPPGPETPPSYEATLERYYSLRGRRLVYASVNGTWQATGRRVADRFEVLNASGSSLIMLDPYTGKVFTAGRNPTDNLYLSSVSLQEGASARAKPAEVQLRNQRLADALPILYQMQREPGLVHIYVSGDLILAENQDAPELRLEQDLTQTRLRRVQDHGDGRVGFHYLTASELIEAANLRVDAAVLTLVATYATPPAAQTVTPLPSPPPTPLPGTARRVRHQMVAATQPNHIASPFRLSQAE